MGGAMDLVNGPKKIIAMMGHFTKNGESKLIGFFMGQIMKEVKGNANPKSIKEFINKYIGN